MKFIHDGIEFDLCKPEMDGWEFKEYRRIKCDEKYFDLGSTGTWVGERPSHDPHWIATKVEPVKPVVEGWAFLEDEPRHPEEGERYYSDISQGLFLANYNLRRNKYWIATKVEPKGYNIVRCEIKPDNSDYLCYWKGAFGYKLSRTCDDPNFTGLFENEDGVVHTGFISYWHTEKKCYMKRPLFVTDIESGKVEVHHAKYALFFE